MTRIGVSSDVLGEKQGCRLAFFRLRVLRFSSFVLVLHIQSVLLKVATVSIQFSKRKRPLKLSGRICDNIKIATAECTELFTYSQENLFQISIRIKKYSLRKKRSGVLFYCYQFRLTKLKPFF